MPSTLLVECPHCKKPFRAPKAWKKWRRHRFEGKVYWQVPVVYCSMNCAHD